MVANLLSCNVWLTLLVSSGFYLQQTSANYSSNSNATGSGTKIPCPDANEGKKLFAGRELHIDNEVKKGADDQEKYFVSMVSMELYKNVQDKQKLINNDKESYKCISPLCDTSVRNYTFFMDQIYLGLGKCSARFCSDARACIRKNNLCPQDSDNLAVLDGYTRCVKAQYNINYKNKKCPDNYQDVCTCAFCDNKNKEAIFYLLFENAEALPGVYFYLRLDSNPFTWDSSALSTSYKVNIPNKLDSSQVVNLDYYALHDQSKYAELFELKHSPSSTCASGAIYLAMLPDYKLPPSTKPSG